MFLYRECRFWLDSRGRAVLVGRQGTKTAMMTFDPSGMDARPGRPAASLDAGHRRADRRLCAWAGEALAAAAAKAA